jgi:antitoxin HicB
LLVELKIELYKRCREMAVTRAELMRRLEWNRESVDRLFRLDHHSKLSQLEAALGALGCRVRMNVESGAPALVMRSALS